jgi:uncharacterized protein YecE (DUF72 family)
VDVRIGTSGWNYTEWRGSFYPGDMKPAGMLAYYAERFSTVEVNNTFYRTPTAKTVAGWATAVPARFTFVLKAPQRITHFARLHDVDDPVRFFCDLRSAFEFRNPTWFTEEVYTRLAARNAALCIADNDDGATPAVATADWGYLRLRATGYADDDLRAWLATMHRIGERWRDAFVFFKHEDAGTGPALGARLAKLVETA